MSAKLEQLVDVRSSLVEEVLTYLDTLAEEAAYLPKYYPPRLRSVELSKTGFDDLRQMVQVVEDRTAYERWLAEERERLRATGYDIDRLAYDPTKSRPETEGDELRHGRRDRPAPPPPPPLSWDEHAGKRFNRAVILGDPGFGKTWLLRYEARRLARTAAERLRNQTVGLDEVVLPIFARLSDVNRNDGPLEEILGELVGRRLSQKFKYFVQLKFQTDRCVILLDAWHEAQPDLKLRITNFANDFPKSRILLTSHIAGYDSGHPPVPDAQELKLLAFDQQQIESFIRVWYGGDTQNCTDFLEMMALYNDLSNAAKVPILLKTMCQTGPDRRTELYQSCLSCMLQNVVRPPVDLMQLLMELALNHLICGDQQFSRAFLQATISTQQKALGCSALNTAELEEWIMHTGVIRADGGHSDVLSFLLPTFGYYLAARKIAQLIKRSKASSLEQMLDLPIRGLTAQQIVDEKTDDPMWQAVLVFLAGQLPVEKALLLVKQLMDLSRVNTTNSALCKKEDRLFLATLCLNEIKILE